jgi:hypothetical protein
MSILYQTIRRYIQRDSYFEEKKHLYKTGWFALGRSDNKPLPVRNVSKQISVYSVKRLKYG